MDPTLFAAAYVTAVRNLGDMIATKVDLKLAVHDPKGDLDKTVKLLNEILDKEETRNDASRSRDGRGRAHRASDDSEQQRRDAKRALLYDANGQRVYVRGTDEVCNLCKGKPEGARASPSALVRPRSEHRGRPRIPAQKSNLQHARSTTARRPP